MKALILGKERQLTNIDPSGLFFLTNPRDMSETGIYSGETIENWGDEVYLNRIRAHEQMIFFKEDSQSEPALKKICDTEQPRTYSELIDLMAADLQTRLKNSSSLGPEFISDAIHNGRTRELISLFVGYRHQELKTKEAQPKFSTEYRYENQAIGQGHYFTDLTDCLESARHASKEHPAETFLIEQFKPQRTPLATLKNNVLDFIPDKPFTVQTAEKTSEDIRRLRKSNHGMQPISMIVKNLRKSANFIISTSQKACLYNAIEIIQDTEQQPKPEIDKPSEMKLDELKRLRLANRWLIPANETIDHLNILAKDRRNLSINSEIALWQAIGLLEDIFK